MVEKNKIIEKKALTMLRKRKPQITMYDTIFKVAFFVYVGVGTSALLKRTTSEYLYDETLTFGVDLWVKKITKDVDFREKILEVEGRTVKLLILRLSAEERFRPVIPRYIKAAHGAIIMYDTTRSATLEKIPGWITLVRKHLGAIPIILVGGKADLADNREVAREEALEIKESAELDAFIECDSKTGEKVEDVFEIISRLMVQGLEST